MPPEEQQQSEPIDIRLYIGMLFFRWKVIAVCFLYALLGGVLYIRFTTPQYQATAVMHVYQDRWVRVSSAVREWGSPGKHAQLLSRSALREQVIDQLSDKWATQVGGRRAMNLAPRARARGSRLVVSVRSSHRRYAISYLNALIAEHEKTWRGHQQQSITSTLRKLEEELALTEQRVEDARNEVIEYTRLNDLMRQQIRTSIEESFIQGVIRRRMALETQLFMMETVNPELRESNFAVIDAVDRLAGGVMEVATADSEKTADSSGPARGNRDETEAWLEEAFDNEDPERLVAEEAESDTDDMEAAPATLRIRWMRLQQQQKDMQVNLEPAHPRLRQVEAQIRGIENQLKVAARLRRARLEDKHRAMLVHLKSLEAVEYKWSAKQLETMVKQTELARLRDRVGRYESNYKTLYARYNEMRIGAEADAERFAVTQRANAGTSPVWPDAGKVLLVALVIGLGSGFGLALGLQFLDNKVQTIKDVEQGLGIDFIGGVPFWVHSGLERTIRPIVTEEHSTGAIEAYRALRTNLTTAMAKLNEQILFITSADSREGKTLTALNLAIMTAKMDKRVLLIDFDLRRGRLHRSLNVVKTPGVSDALKEGRSLREAVKETRIENLFLAPCGSSVDGSAELLQQANLLEALVELQDYYDYILIDTSPILRVTDTVILTTQGVGAVVYVARVNHTPKPLIKYSLNMLKEAQVLGLIMNSIEMHKISSLYYAYQYPNYAYYSNAYAYGYNYYHYGEQRGKSQKFRRKHPVQDAKQSVGRWFRRTFFPMQ